MTTVDPRGRVPKTTYKGPSTPWSGASVTKRAPDSTTDIQKFLRAQGYAIPVDGKFGDLTRSALADWHSGKGRRNPDAWTAKLLKIHDSAHTNSPASRNNQVNQAGASPNNSAKTSTIKTGTGAPNLEGLMGGLGGLYSNDTLDPDLYAKSMVETEYGPILAELQREEQRIRSAGPQHLANIDQIYANMRQSNDARSLATNELSQRLQNTTTSTAGSLVSALGLEAADPSVRTTLGANASIEGDYLRDVGAANQQYGLDIGNALNLEQGYAKQAAMSEDNTTLEDIIAKRSETMGGMGGAMNKYRLDAMGTLQDISSSRMKDQLALAQFKMAMAMAPLDKQKQIAAITGMGLDQDLTRAQIGATNRSNRPKPATNAGAPRNFGQLTGDKTLELQNSILESIPQGAKVKDIVRIINSTIRAAGYDPFSNLKAKQFALNAARAAGIAKPDPRWWGGGR